MKVYSAICILMLHLMVNAEKFISDLEKIAKTTLDSKILSHDKEHFPVPGSRLVNILFRCKRITGYYLACSACNEPCDYLVARYMLEIDSFDETAHAVIMMFDETSEEYLQMTTSMPHKVYPVMLAQFHSADYVGFLQQISLDTQHLFSEEMRKCKKFSLVIPKK
ncbi:histone deacetylase 9-like protein [Tanacetum coccineum]